YTTLFRSDHPVFVVEKDRRMDADEAQIIADDAKVSVKQPAPNQADDGDVEKVGEKERRFDKGFASKVPPVQKDGVDEADPDDEGDRQGREVERVDQGIDEAGIRRQIRVVSKPDEAVSPQGIPMIQADDKAVNHRPHLKHQPDDGKGSDKQGGLDALFSQ